MRQVPRLIILLILLVATDFVSAATAFVSYPDDFPSAWTGHKGDTVTFNNLFYVCEIDPWNDQLTIAYRRLRTPEEYAVGLSEGDSTDYYRIAAQNAADKITLHYDVSNSVRLGATIERLRARIDANQRLTAVESVTFTNNDFPTTRPDLGDASLVVCGANIQNYWVTFGENGAENEEQFQTQTTKISKALVHIDADIYAICELEEGTKAVSTLVNAMNKTKGMDVYAYTETGFDEYPAMTTNYIYRKDKVKPYGKMQFPYSTTYSAFHYRMMMIGFEELTTGGKFVLSLNHLLSKVSETTDDTRLESCRKLITKANSIIKNNTFQDPDILFLGDYNNYTMEAPNQYLVESGLVDQLMRLDSAGYSYSYNGEVGYLDRCFSTPSMNDQITAVHPYHLNTDTYYRYGYKYADTSMYRYADHDPILVGLRLRIGTDLHEGTVPYSIKKVVQDGQLLILRDGKLYTIQGFAY
ncbi:MAG: hypothetical protein MJZ59_03225 [Paludibacteraceae bacterium]|nr:hypothetical protein [Paludibacteraceae bacterium]